MLERRIGDSCADRRVGQRIDRRLRLTSLAWTGEDLTHVGRQRGDAPVDAYRRLHPGPRMNVAGREIQNRLTDALCDDIGSALQRHVEIGYDNLTRGTGVAPERDDG